MEAYIFGSAWNEISLDNLTFDIPRFLRFNEVELFYTRGSKSIEEKCWSIGSYLEPLKEALNDSISIQFHGDIDRNDPKNFGDHSKLLGYISEELLTICNSSRGYDFYIFLRTEEAEAEANVINSIIQMPQICRCSNLRLDLWLVRQQKLLPVETISSWLNRTIGDRRFFIGRTPKEIFLRIYASGIQNVMEMCDHLVEVCLFCFIKL